jgi:hypothetical protein
MCKSPQQKQGRDQNEGSQITGSIGGSQQAWYFIFFFQVHDGSINISMAFNRF